MGFAFTLVRCVVCYELDGFAHVCVIRFGSMFMWLVFGGWV